MSDEVQNTTWYRRPIASLYVGLAGAWLLIAFAVSCKSMKDIPENEQIRVDSGWPRANEPWETTKLPPLRVEVPTITDAEYVNDDQLCSVCHDSYVKAFANNVHRRESCEGCHGPASRHLDSRGKDPGSILSFKRLQPAQRSEVCAKCHEENGCAPGNEWRRSAHAHSGVACTDCHAKNHYNVSPDTPKVTPTPIAIGSFPKDWKIQLVSTQAAREEEVERKKTLPSLRGTSNNLGAVAPNTCYQCHGDKHELEEVAHPHQIHGPNSLNCTSCHNPHGNVLPSSRKELCLQCHGGATPNAAWHSSTHDLVGVACTDCHNPHPNTSVQRVVNINHTSVRRPKRLPMSVNEPEACYKCHPKILGQTGLPSHHPIKEGKVTCSDCHDPHGQAEGNLKEPTLNMVCYKCHAEKQGPFVYEHPPVTEDCSHCHDPHGTVANNLLRQPPVFLCLRCHTGHRAPPSDHFGIGTVDIDGNAALRPAYYSDCTQCHDQIHGSNHPSQHRAGALLR